MQLSKAPCLASYCVKTEKTSTEHSNWTLTRAEVTGLWFTDHTAFLYGISLPALQQGRLPAFGLSVDIAATEEKAAPCPCKVPCPGERCWFLSAGSQAQSCREIFKVEYDRASVLTNLPHSFTAISCGSFFPCFSKPSCCY